MQVLYTELNKKSANPVWTHLFGKEECFLGLDYTVPGKSCIAEEYFGERHFVDKYIFEKHIDQKKLLMQYDWMEQKALSVQIPIHSVSLVEVSGADSVSEPMKK